MNVPEVGVSESCKELEEVGGLKKKRTKSQATLLMASSQ